jgi:hypothetical protein
LRGECCRRQAGQFALGQAGLHTGASAHSFRAPCARRERSWRSRCCATVSCWRAYGTALLRGPACWRAYGTALLRGPACWRAYGTALLRRPACWRAYGTALLRGPACWRAYRTALLRGPACWRSRHRACAQTCLLARLRQRPDEPTMHESLRTYPIGRFAAFGPSLTHDCIERLTRSPQ